MSFRRWQRNMRYTNLCVHQHIHDRHHSFHISLETEKVVTTATGENQSKSLQSLKHDNTILQAIRKSISGTAAKVIGCLPFSSTIDKIIEGLDVSFGELKNDAANWQMFYNARQQKTESIIDWNIRLMDLWKKVPTATVPDTEADNIIKAQLWIGLKTTDVKNASRHFNDNTDKSSSDLLLYIRGLEDTTLLQQQSGKLVLPVSSDGATDEVSAYVRN